jgi:hypothetical protein
MKWEFKVDKVDRMKDKKAKVIDILWRPLINE